MVFRPVSFPAQRSSLKGLFLPFLGAFAFILIHGVAIAQKLSGQWIGGFGEVNNPKSIRTDYVLEMDFNGNQIAGYSYTYFSISGKRYFVICRLKGNYDPGSKSLTVNEVEKVKSNTPPDFQNCLQSHSLTYFKQKDKELLIGKWKPYEKGSTCGSGNTELERKVLNGSSSIVKNESNKSTTAKVNSPTPNPSNPSTKTETKTPESTQSNQQSIQRIAIEKPSDKKSNNNLLTSPKSDINQKNLVEDKDRLAKRNYQVIKTIEIEPVNFKVDIYDNGQIDGDTVSIYLNDKLLVSSKMLTAKPITIAIDVDENEDT
ncbi:MAG: hypothetical protein RL131_1378, partial [Bacteroidota bacterium]